MTTSKKNRNENKDEGNRNIIPGAEEIFLKNREKKCSQNS